MDGKQQPVNILICDDAVTNLLILSELIKSEISVNITTESDPRKVLTAIESQEFDLLILDIEMPHINGLELTEKIRQKYSVDELPIIILTGVQSLETRKKALTLGANDFINKPFDQVEVILRAKNLLKVREAFKLQKLVNSNLEAQVQLRTQELAEATEALVFRLAMAGEIRDNETGHHVVRVGKYSRLLATKAGLPEQLCFLIEKTAPLHDIGKIGIPDSILHKSGELDQAEWDLMHNHTAIGARLLGEHPSLMIQMAKTIALTHHERWDGQGYPSGLSGESIPIEGRITAVSDMFDALSSKRPYKEAWPLDKVVTAMQENAGASLDPNLIELFLANLDEFTSIQRQYAD